MKISPRFLKRATAVAAVSLTAAATLTGCTGASSATPDEVFKDYILALNAGDIAAAIELVSEPGDITADNAVRLEALGDLPAPKLSQALELDDKIESTTVYFDFSQDEPYAVSFVKNDGTWQLQEPLFFEESRAASAKESIAEVAGQDNRSGSTWWEVLDELEITTELPSGEEFTFPDYIAGVEPGEHAPIPLTVSNLPDWEYLQETPFESAELTVVNQGGENQGYTLDLKLAEDPLRDEIVAAVEAALKGQTTIYTDGGGFMRSGTEYAVEVLDATDGCASNLHQIPMAPDLVSPDWEIMVHCDFSYSDSQYPGETKQNRITVSVDRTGSIDEETLSLDSLGVGAWG